MNKEINELIPIAITHLSNPKNGLLNCDKKGKIGIDKKVNGYVASLGPAVLQSGLFSTIAFFDKKQEANLKPNLSKVMAKVISSYYEKEYKNGDRLIELLIKEYHSDDEDKTQKSIQKYQRELLNTTIAFKLAIRTFYLYEDESS